MASIGSLEITPDTRRLERVLDAISRHAASLRDELAQIREDGR